VTQAGGRPLFFHHSSLEQLLREVYPSFPWDSSRFVESGRSAQGYWSNVDNQKKFIARVGRELGLKQVSYLLHIFLFVVFKITLFFPP